MSNHNAAPQPDNSSSPGSSLLPVQKDVSAAYYLKLGKSLYQSYLTHSHQHDLDAAIQNFQKAVEIEPNLAEAYVQLATALWDQGAINLELAQFYCETALKLDPSQAEANLYLGYFLQRGGFLDDAAQQFRYATTKNFWKASRSRIALGHTLLKQAVQARRKTTQLSLAFQGLGQFLSGCALLPLDKQTCNLLRDALLSDSQVYTLTAMANSFKLLKMPQMARQLYTLGTRLQPKEPLFYHLLGDEYLYEADDPQVALKYYKQAQALDPNNLSLLKKIGQAYASANDTPHAVEVLNAVIELNANDFETLYSLAQLHMEEKAYFKALYYFKEAQNYRPRYPYLHSNIAYILFKMEDMEGAIEEYKVALDYGTDPMWLSTVAHTLGTMFYQLYGDMPNALDYLQQSLHFNPENKEALSLLADLYFQSGQLEIAISVYKSILQIDPENSDCYSNIAYILWQMDRNDAAIDAYMAAIYYDKDNHIAHNNLAVIYLDDENNAEKALPLFNTALELKPDYTLACFNSARALQVMGKTMEAAERFSEALCLNQLSPELDDAEIQDHIKHLFD